MRYKIRFFTDTAIRNTLDEMRVESIKNLLNGYLKGLTAKISQVRLICFMMEKFQLGVHLILRL